MVGGCRGRKEGQGDLPICPDQEDFLACLPLCLTGCLLLKFAPGPSSGLTTKIPCLTPICVWPQACILGQKPWAVLVHTAEGNTQRMLPEIPADQTVLLIKGSSFPLLTSWHHDIEASDTMVITQGWRSGRDSAALAQYQTEAGVISFKKCRCFPLQKSGFISSCLQTHLQSIPRFGLFLRKFKGDSEFYWLQTPISSGAAAAVAVNWSHLKAESLYELSHKCPQSSRWSTRGHELWAAQCESGPCWDHVLPTCQEDHSTPGALSIPKCLKLCGIDENI